MSEAVEGRAQLSSSFGRGEKERRPMGQAFRLLRPVSARAGICLGILGVLAFLLLWQIGHDQTSIESQRFLPSPLQVLSALTTLIIEKNYLADVLVSALRVFISFSAVCIIAIPLGLVMGCFAPVRAFLNPLISAARYLPAASFVPLLLVWFGPTDSQKLALLFLGVVFFLVTLVLDNVEAVQKELIEAALTMGARREQIVTGVVFRAAAPAILDSMRNMIAVGWTYLVIAEIVAAQDGIGAVMMRAGRFLKVDIIMAGILTIGLLGVLTDILFRAAGHWLFPWNRPRKG